MWECACLRHERTQLKLRPYDRHLEMCAFYGWDFSGVLRMALMCGVPSARLDAAKATSLRSAFGRCVGL